MFFVVEERRGRNGGKQKNAIIAGVCHVRCADTY
jgi:hypothetical protein